MKYSVKNIPANLKKYRLEHHKKQVEMAAFLEMNYQNYSKMERGYYNHLYRNLWKFVKSFILHRIIC
jgi:DNA-binding XRE family transcriptional regulator